MQRRDSFLALVSLGALPGVVAPQERAVRIGVLVGRRNSTFLPPLLKRLAELGYVEGRNLLLDYRSAEGDAERFPGLARELIAAKCDLIFAIGAAQAASALVEAKSPVPVVIIANDYDPVKAGIVSNLRRPGANVTGVYLSQLELSAKRIEFMHAAVPRAVRYLVLGDVFTQDQLEATKQAARLLHTEVVAVRFDKPPYAIDSAFATGRARRVQAVIVLTSPHLFDQRARISELALKHRLPASVGYPAAGWGDEGFLISYAADQSKVAARAADIAVNILRGAQAGDMAVEQATHYELVINRKTAKALGLTIPQSLSLRADRFIE